MLEKNSWNNIRLLCGCHEEECEMQIQQGGQSLFYACPKYGERPSCRNRITFIEYEALLAHLTKIGSGDDGLVEYDITNHEWTSKKGVKYKISKKDPKTGKMDVRMINKRALEKF